MHRRLLSSLLLSSSMVLSASALAQTGVSDDRVSLPDGPGSLDGIGDNASVDANMGQMSTSVKIRVPGGFDGVTPELSLSYSSGGGGGVLGTGWTMALPFIERMTSKGLPDYDEDDRFVFGGGEQLVRVDALSDVDTAVYRARFEGGFVRYTWHERGNGDEGYWTSESPDGAKTTYGADFDGTANEGARVRSPDGIFRYLATETQDAFGHRMVFTYQNLGGKAYIDSIAYVIDDEGTAGQRVVFTYEERDDKISDARGGFNEVTGHRLTDVEVFTGNTRIRHYELTYEPYANAGGASRLSRVRTFGANGSLYPIQYTFTYSKSLAGVCDGVECEAPFVVDVGSLDGVNLQAGNATLVDMNGDGLPDFIETPTDGSNHQIYISELDEDGTHSFSNPQPSALNDTSSTQLTIPGVQMLDHDGDGFADLVNALTGQIFVNDASGDWAGTINVGASGSLAASDFDFDEDADELTTLRFFDYNSDGMIDILKAAGTGTAIVENTGAGFANVPTVEDIGATFVDNNLELADMNGDGLLDPTIIAAGEVRYRINLGHGKWADWKTVPATQITVDNLDFTSLEDLNGDGIDDVVTVIADTLTFALNRNGDHFDTVQTLTTVGGSPIPYRDADTTVLFADMNANGSNDVVWVTSTGGVQYLEMFPVRPNLLTRYENGIGLVTEVTYKSAVQERAKNPQGWPDPIPTPMLVVSTIDTYAAAGDPSLEIHNLTVYSYEQGFYDGVEKQFRGFGRVRTSQEGDEHQEAVSKVQTFHLGQGGLPERAGQQLTEVTYNADDAPVLSITNTYDACDVGGFDEESTSPPVRWQCLTAIEEVIQEGLPQSEWVTTLAESAYDGYGNVVEEREHGVTQVGGQGCGACISPDGTGEPCGPQCLGDERFTDSTYISPEDNSDIWNLNLLVEESKYASPTSRRSGTRYFYDGQPFVGLPAGQATQGFLSRAEQKVDDNTWAPVERAASDAHGNVIEFIGANGDVASGGHRTFTTFSDDGLDITHQETMVSDAGGDYRLQRDLTYEPLFGKMASATKWSVVGGPTGLHMSWTYDEHGRRITAIKDGDTPAAPTEAYVYDFASPVSKVTTFKRSAHGGSFDIEETSCFDGLGREVQTRTRIADDRYVVSGLSIFNHRGEVVREYKAFESDTGDCSLDVPPDTPVTTYHYDGLGRNIRVEFPDADERDGTASVRRTVYGPLRESIFNEDDNDPDAPGFNTPSLIVRDGLDRIVRTERKETPTSTPIRYHVRYDDLFNLRGFIDPEGNEKVQTYDLRSRLVRVDDPDAGTIRLELDNMGNVVREENGAGDVMRRAYDEQGRMVREWDDADEAGTLREFFYDRHPTCPASICQNLGALLAGQRFAAGDLGTVEEQLTYDAHGNMVRTERIIGGRSYVFVTEFDNADRLVKETFPGGFELDYTLDAMGRFTSVAGFVDDVQHDANGMVKSFDLANGLTQSYTFNVRDQVSGMRVVDAADTAVIDHTYHTDRAGNLRAIDDHVELQGVPSRTAAFDLDGLNRLVRTVLDDGGDFDETITTSYDALDRITDKSSSKATSPAHIGAYSYDDAGPKAVTTAGDIDWSYNAGGFAVDKGDLSMEWSASGKIRRITDDAGNEWTYHQNANDEPFYRTSNHGSEIAFGPRFLVRDGVARITVGIDADPVAYVETNLGTDFLTDGDDSGSINAHDAFLARDTNEVSTLLRNSARAMFLGDDDTDTQFLLQDLQGNTLAVTDDDGEVVERFDYYAFGSTRYSSSVQTENLRFAGVEREPCGLYNFGKRLYAPEEGRWTAVDPGFVMLDGKALESFTAAVSSYGYAGNNPATFVDFGGTIDWKKVGKVALGVVAVAGAVTGLVFAAPAIAGAAATALAAATVVNTVGAIVGGVTSAVSSTITSYTNLKADYSSQGKSVPKSAIAKAIGKGILNAGIGTVSGFFSGGVSAGFTVAQTGVKVAESKGVITTKTANILTAGLTVGSALTGVINPLGLATSSADAGSRAATSSAISGVKAGVEAYGNSKRSKRNLRSRAKRKFRRALKKLKAKLKAKPKKAVAKGKSDGGKKGQ